jgi:hypothetical protein
VRDVPLGGKKLSTIQIQCDTSSKTLEIETPNGIQYCREFPECDAMVRAEELLQAHERHAIKKIGGTFTVEVDGKYGLVYSHHLVPQYAKILRSTSGSLIGFPGCCGG